MNWLKQMLSGDKGNASVSRSSLFVVGFMGVWLLLLETGHVIGTGKWLTIENEALWITLITALSAGYSVMRVATKGKSNEADS